MRDNPNLLSLLEKAKEIIETSRIFGGESSEILSATFCMLVSSLIYYGIASFLNVTPYTIFITLPFLSLAALAGGFILFRLLTGKFAQERRNIEIKGNSEILITVNEGLEEIEKIRELSRDSLASDLEAVKSTMDFLKEIKKLPEGSEEKHIAMELAYSSLRRFKTSEEVIGKIQNKAISSSLSKELKTLANSSSEFSE